MKMPGRLAAACFKKILPVVVLAVLAGCAGHQPYFARIGIEETDQVKAAFLDRLAAERQCGCCLDAELAMDFTAGGMLGSRSGSIDGYLQAMPPASFKLIGVNPLGQPLLFITSDGSRFRTIVVPETKVYEGAIDSKTFRKYAPAGFVPAELFFWLTGNLRSEPPGILAVHRDLLGRGYWLTLEQVNGELVHRLLFDPVAGLVREQLLENEAGEVVLAVGYNQFQAVGLCDWPTEVTLRWSAENDGKAVFRFVDLRVNSEPESIDFDTRVPGNFERVLVE